MNTSSEEKNKRYADEITLSEVVISVAELVKWTRNHALGLILCCGLSCGFALFWVAQQPEEYVAELSFMLNDDNNPSISGVGGVLSQLGIGSSGGKYNVDKLLEIAKSDRIIDSTLLQESLVSGRRQILANHFIETYDLEEQWKNHRDDMSDFRIDNEDFQNEQTLYAMRSLRQMISGTKQNRENALLSSDYGNTDYIMSFYMKTLSDSLSISFVEHLYENVSKFFIDKTIEGSQRVYDLIIAERDSLSKQINETAHAIAELEDKSLGSFRNTNNVRLALLKNKLIGYQASFQIIVENLGRAKYALKTSTPLVQLLDKPTHPLSSSGQSYVKYGVLGFASGLIFYLFILFATLVYGKL